MLKGLATGSNGIIILLVGIITYFALSDKFSYKKVAKFTIENAQLSTSIERLESKLKTCKEDDSLKLMNIYSYQNLVKVQSDSIKVMNDSLKRYQNNEYVQRGFFGKKKWKKK